MAVCTHCGNVNADGDKFCGACGAPLTPSEIPAAAAAAAAAAVVPEVPAAAPEVPVSAPEAPEVPVSAPEAPAPEAAAPELTFDAPQPVYTPPQPAYTPPQPAYTPPQPGAAQPIYAETVPPYASGGLIAWAAVSILLCLIPGVVALISALGINNSATVEEQQRKIANTKTWCIVATALGGLSVVGSLVSRLLGG